MTDLSGGTRSPLRGSGPRAFVVAKILRVLFCCQKRCGHSLLVLMKQVHPRDKAILTALLRIAVFKVVLPYLRHLIDEIRGAADPTEALKRQLYINRLPASAVTALLGSAVGVCAGAQVAVSSLGFFSGIGYSLGLVAMPLWGPVAGGVLGAVAVGGAAYATLTMLRPQKTSEVAAGPSSLAVATAASVMIPPEVWSGTEELLDAFLEVDFGASARQRRKDILAKGVDLAAAAATVAATVSGRVDLLAVVAEGYALARAALAGSGRGEHQARRQAHSLAARLGVEPKALEMLLDTIDEQLDHAARTGAT